MNINAKFVIDRVKTLKSDLFLKRYKQMHINYLCFTHTIIDSKQIFIFELIVLSLLLHESMKDIHMDFINKIKMAEQIHKSKSKSQKNYRGLWEIINSTKNIRSG